MAWQYKNRWFRRWLLVIVFWAVPVMIVAVNEMREQLAYNNVDLDTRIVHLALHRRATRARRTRARHGSLDQARASGCPPTCSPRMRPGIRKPSTNMLDRRSMLSDYLWHAFVGYWVVPAAFLFGVGVVIGGIRRALRRPARAEVKTTTPAMILPGLARLLLSTLCAASVQHVTEFFSLSE